MIVQAGAGQPGRDGAWMPVMGWKLFREHEDLREGAGDTKERG